MGRFVNRDAEEFQVTEGIPERAQGARYRFGALTLDSAHKTLFHGVQPMPLGSRAFALLSILVRNAGQTVTKADLFEAAWPGSAIEESNLRVHIAAIRRVLNEHLGEAIQNEPGRGYRFVVPITVEPAQRGVDAAPLLRLAGEDIVGRAGAIAEIAALLPLRRFVTLTGPGGVGKTTIALAVAAQLGPNYEDGVLLLDFAVAQQPSDLMHILAAALIVKAPEQELAVSVFAELKRRDVLLVLDNCEHLIEAATELADSVRAHAPQVNLLATSREPMRTHGEWVYPVPALAWPPEESEHTLAGLAEYPAAELLVARLNTIGYRPSLSDADVPDLATIARKLDGLPLAIELAAANAELFSIADLAERLDERLSLLTIGHRRIESRHQTLEAMIAWSYATLASEHARSWRCLGAFAGEFNLAEACTMIADAGVAEARAPQLFFELVGKSLVDRSVRAGKVSFRLLESLRIFALQKLADRCELDAARAVHARLILDRIRGANDRWGRADLLGTQSNNDLAELRLSLEWALLNGKDIDLGVDLAVESAPLWFRRRQLRELQGYLEEAARQIGTPGEDCPYKQIGRLELALAHTRFHQDGVGSAVEDGLLRSEQAANMAGDLDTELEALWALFGHASVEGNYLMVAEYTRRYERALPDEAEPLAAATTYRMRALSQHLQGDQREALSSANQGLENLSFLSKESAAHVFQYDHRIATLAHRAKTAWLLGRCDIALADCDTILSTARNMDQPFGLGHALATAACPVAIWHGDLDRAEDYVGTLLDLSSGISNVWRSAGIVYRFALDHLRGVAGVWPSAQLSPFYRDVLASISPELLTEDCWQRTQQVPEHWCTAEIHRAYGEQRLQAAGPDGAIEAERHFRLALEIARRQGATAWALRASLSLAQLGMRQSRIGLAEDLLALFAAQPAISESRDYALAKTVLAELAREQVLPLGG